jgi:hypothetical protein
LFITSAITDDARLPDFLQVRDETGAVWKPVILTNEFQVVSQNGLLSLLMPIGEGHSGVVFKGILKRNAP